MVKVDQIERANDQSEQSQVLFVPMSAVTLSTLSPEDRADGASTFSLSRSIGSSVGISVFSC